MTEDTQVDYLNQEGSVSLAELREAKAEIESQIKQLEAIEAASREVERRRRRDGSRKQNLYKRK